MKIAMTVWEGKISPVFDSAQSLLIAEIENGEVKNKRYEHFNSDIIFRLEDVLKNLGVDVLICGAISEVPSKIIEDSGINIIPFIGGNVEEIFDSYINGIRIIPEFLMPGCGRKYGQSGKKENVFLTNKKR